MSEPFGGFLLQEKNRIDSRSPPPAGAPGGSLVLNEDFSNPNYSGSPYTYKGTRYLLPNSRIWNLSKDGNGGGNLEAQYYNDNTSPQGINGIALPVPPPNVYIGNDEAGRLALVLEAYPVGALRKDDGSPVSYPHDFPHSKHPGEPTAWAQGWYSGKVTTKDKFYFQYGRIDIRAKFTTQRGTWSAIWALPQEMEGMDSGRPTNVNTWPILGELDLMEFIGKSISSEHTGPVDTFSAALNYGDPYPGHKYTTIHYRNPSGRDLALDYHTYSIIWEPGKITWLFDNVKYGERTGFGIPEAATKSPYLSKGTLANCQSYASDDGVTPKNGTTPISGVPVPNDCLCSSELQPGATVRPGQPGVCPWNYDLGAQYLILNLAIGGMLGGKDDDGRIRSLENFYAGGGRIKMFVESIRITDLGQTRNVKQP